MPAIDPEYRRRREAQNSERDDFVQPVELAAASLELDAEVNTVLVDAHPAFGADEDVVATQGLEDVSVS